MPLKLVERHGSPNWYLRGSVRGHRVDESTGTGDRKAAEQIRVRREAEILTRTIHGDTATRTFAEAALSYMETGGERTHIGPLLDRFGKRKLSSLGQHDIDQAAKALKPGAAPATINRHIHTPMAAVLHHAAEKGWMPKPVIARPKMPKGRIRWITYAEADDLIAMAAPHLEPLVIFLLSTGARLSEALYLDWRQVDLGRGHVTFLDTKNGEDRGVPLHPRAVAALANLPHRKGAVFRRPRKGKKACFQGEDTREVGDAYADRGGEGGGQVKTAWRTMCKNAGIMDFSPHDCRHTWATWHYMENRDVNALMELGGWKSLDMVIRYTHINKDHLAAGIGKMWGNRGDQTPGEVVIPLPSKA